MLLLCYKLKKLQKNKRMGNKLGNSIFSFLENENQVLFNLITDIEKMIFTDPHGAIIKGRVYGEILSKIIAEESEREDLNELNQIDRIKVLGRDNIITPDMETALHNVRMLGNKAAHGDVEDDYESALAIHRNIYKATCWFWVEYVSFNFVPQPYRVPIFTLQEKSSSADKLEILIGEVKDMLTAKAFASNSKPHLAEESVVENLGSGQTVDSISNLTKEDTEEIKNSVVENSKICIEDIQLNEGDSAYIYYCKEEFRKYLSEEQWKFNNTNGCITIYNKVFKDKFESIDSNLAPKMKLQIWMERPEKEKANLQIEIAGGGAENKALRLAISSSLKRKFPVHSDIILGKETVAVVMTLKLAANGITEKETDTIDKLESNVTAIEEGVKTFIEYLNVNALTAWINEEFINVVKTFNNEEIQIKDEVIKPKLEIETGEDKKVGGSRRMKKMITQSERMNIESIEKKVNRNNIILDPSFQRNYVYTTEKASGVIQSILLNMPLGVVYLAEIEKKNLCVDGQQRLTSILKFIRNEFPLKKLDVLTELSGLYFKDLDEDMQDEIYDYSMEITKIKECDYDQIYFLYEKLNVGSVKLNAQEIRRCVYAGLFNDMIEEIVEDEPIATFFQDIDNNRLKRVEVLINALAVADNPYYRTSRKQLLNNYMELHKGDDEKAVENTKNNILRVFKLIKDVLGDRAFKFSGKDGISMTLVYPIINSFTNFDHKDIRLNADKIREALVNINQPDVCIFNPNGNVNGDAKGVKYTIDRINSIIQDAIGTNTDSRERNFPKEWKDILFDKQEGNCGICNQRILDVNDTEIDHIVPFSQGGETIFENAQLAHVHCNRSKGNRL